MLYRNIFCFHTCIRAQICILLAKNEKKMKKEGWVRGWG